MYKSTIDFAIIFHHHLQKRIHTECAQIQKKNKTQASCRKNIEKKNERIKCDKIRELCIDENNKKYKQFNKFMTNYEATLTCLYFFFPIYSGI